MPVPTYRILVVGDQGTGKTSWLKKISCSEDLDMPLHLHLSTSMGDIDLLLEESSSIPYECDIHAIVSTYDVTRSDTLKSALSRFDKESPHVEVFVLGLKADLVGWSPRGTPDILLDSIENADCGNLVLRYIVASLQGRDFHDISIKKITIHDSRMEKLEEKIDQLERFIISARNYIQACREGRTMTEEEIDECLEASKKMGVMAYDSPL